MQQPWFQGQRWLASRECHNLCLIIAALPASNTGVNKLQELFGVAVAPFLRPSELIAMIEQGTERDNNRGRLRLMDAETLVMVSSTNLPGTFDSDGDDVSILPAISSAPCTNKFFLTTMNMNNNFEEELTAIFVATSDSVIQTSGRLRFLMHVPEWEIRSIGASLDGFSLVVVVSY